jgi:hypothetical protein
MLFTALERLDPIRDGVLVLQALEETDQIADHGNPGCSYQHQEHETDPDSLKTMFHCHPNNDLTARHAVYGKLHAVRRLRPSFFKRISPTLLPVWSARPATFEVSVQRPPHLWRWCWG